MKSKILLVIAGMFLSAPPMVRAQAKGYVEARIRFVSMTRPLGSVGLISNGKPQGLVIPTDMLTEELAYKGPSRLELVQLSVSHVEPETGPKSEEKPPKDPTPKKGAKDRQLTVSYRTSDAPPLAWIDLPQKQGLLHLIILVTPGQGNGMVMLNDRPGSFPPGSNRYLNLCTFPLTVRAPSGDYVVPAGGSQIMRPGSLDKTYYDFQLLSREAKILFSTRIYHRESTRKLYILTQLGTTERVQLKAIVDRPAPPKTDDDGEPGKK
jgi:hypothetical protein